MQTLNQTWDLDVFFPGGSDSAQFAEYLQKLEQVIETVKSQLKNLQAPQSSSEGQGLFNVVSTLQDVQKRLVQAVSFVGCLESANSKDKKAVILNGKVRTLNAEYSSLLTNLDQLLMQIDNSVWEELLKNDSFKGIEFPLNERRSAAKEKLSPEQEVLVNDLSVDGYHAWGALYDTTVGQMTIPFEENGEKTGLSVGQAANKLTSGNRQERVQLFKDWEQAWADNAEFCSNALNHLAGFRLQVYKHRGWDSIHKEPLDYNRMSEQTLKMMWDVIDRNKDIFVQYLNRKAKLLGVEKLSWHDVAAPLGSVEKKVSYEEAADFVIEQFRRFSPKMADFVHMAITNRWVEAEDRPNKRPGAFCTGFPDSGQTRVFMTFSGSSSTVSTLAHELGHAFHQHVMEDLPPFAQNYAMNVAETASTLAEMIVSDASLKAATEKEERITLLDEKIERAVAFFMNIHARFIFETNFYAERKKGLVSVERLNQLMTDAQQVAYKEALGEYHPHFWASKLHFYITEIPFYNFPYTFGFLFSSGIYATALEQGSSFEERYIALLRDTGSMTVEELAQRHLGVDLTQPDFWQRAVDVSVADAREFLSLTE